MATPTVAPTIVEQSNFLDEATVFVVPEEDIDGDTGPYRVQRDGDEYRGRRLVTIENMHLGMPPGWGSYSTAEQKR